MEAERKLLGWEDPWGCRRQAEKVREKEGKQIRFENAVGKETNYLYAN